MLGACFHAILRGVCCIGKSLLVVFMTESHSFLSKNMVQGMGDCEHASYQSLGRCCDPPYLAVMSLANPW